MRRGKKLGDVDVPDDIRNPVLAEKVSPAPASGRPPAAPAALVALCAIARFHQVAADASLLSHQLGLTPSEPVDTATLLRAAKQLGLKAKSSRTTPDRLSLTPLPALAVLRNEDFTGTKFNDQISGNAEANVINAGKGNDTLAGGLGGDTYVLALGDGNDSIKESANSVGTSGGSDTLSFAAGIAPAALKATRHGEDLVLSYSANDTVVIGRWFAADPQRIERVTFADGTIWDAAKLTSLVNAPTVQHALVAQKATEDAAWPFVVPADTFAAKGGAALSFNATLANGAALPSWLRFDAKSRTLTGTPLNADVGNLALAVIATDPAGGYTSTALAVTIANTNDAPTAGTPVAAQDVVGGVQWTYTLPGDLFRDVDVGDKLVYSATLSDGKALPAWLSFNAATRTFSGKAGSGDAGKLDLKIIAKDLAGASANQSFKINVAAQAGGKTFVGTAYDDTLRAANKTI